MGAAAGNGRAPGPGAKVRQRRRVPAGIPEGEAGGKAEQTDEGTERSRFPRVKWCMRETGGSGFQREVPGRGTKHVKGRNVRGLLG